MAGRQQEQQQPNNASPDFLWVIGALVVVAVGGWYFGKIYITNTIFTIRIYETYAINIFLHFAASLMNLIGIPPLEFNFDKLIEYLRKLMASDVNFRDIMDTSTLVGNFIRYPLSFFTLVGAAFLYFGQGGRLFRNTYDSKLLLSKEKENWPEIVPVSNLNLINTKLDDGPWAFPLSPMRFCKKFDLLDIEENQGKYKATLRRGAAHRLFSLQVGPRWQGPERLPIHIRALFAIFAARINADKKGAQSLLHRISGTSASGKPDFIAVDSLLRKHVGSNKVAKIICMHGYVTTVMASMLVGARELGVLASAEFLWLKPIDRRMWYMLNTVGRSTAVPEICGAYAHWLAEKKLGLPLMVPMVDEAVKGMEIELSQVIYKPDEE
jgi:intracellular multiplication protein IcmP